MEKLLTLAEAREYLKVSDVTIRRYVKNGKLKTRKIGRQHRLTEADIQEFLDTQNKSEGTMNDERQSTE